MNHISEQEFILKHNRVYGQMIRQERCRRHLSLEALSSGILSRTALDKVEKGKPQWTKLVGDTLMFRMGIVPEYFESLSSGEELDRWRMREDLCLPVPDKPKQAAVKLAEYRNTYSKREPLKAQFLLKAEVVLMLSQAGSDSESILEKAIRAAQYTIKTGREPYTANACLSPEELETILLVIAALFRIGRDEEAWTLSDSDRILSFPSSGLSSSTVIYSKAG